VHHHFQQSKVLHSGFLGLLARELMSFDSSSNFRSYSGVDSCEMHVVL